MTYAFDTIISASHVTCISDRIIRQILPVNCVTDSCHFCIHGKLNYAQLAVAVMQLVAHFKYINETSERIFLVNSIKCGHSLLSLKERIVLIFYIFIRKLSIRINLFIGCESIMLQVCTACESVLLLCSILNN